MTPEELAAIEAREKAATEGPWWFAGKDGLYVTNYNPRIYGPDGRGDHSGPIADLMHRRIEGARHANGHFIAHARTDIPNLIGAVRTRDEQIAARDAEVKRLREALNKIAAEQKVYKGYGDYDVLPALEADEAQSLARAALEAKHD